MALAVPSQLLLMYRILIVVILYQCYCHGVVCQGDDVGWANGIVTSGEGSGAAVARNVDGSDLPPLVGLIFPIFVVLYFILYQYIRCSVIHTCG